MNETTTTSKDVALRKDNGALVSLMPEDAEGVFKVSKYLAQSDLIPKSFGGRAENVFAAIMYGREIGVNAMQALSNIAVVNGRPSVWGELATAMVRQSGLCESLSYKFEGTGATLKCTATGKRKGISDVHVEEFSMEDAKVAGFDKKDTYLKHPKDMLMWKALHRLFKFLWADVLKGLAIREIAVAEAIEAEVIEQVVVEAPAATTEETKRRGRGPAKPKVEAPAMPAAPVHETPKEAPAAPSAAAEAISEIPAEPKEVPSEDLDGEGFAPIDPTTRIFGTVVKAIKKGEIFGVVMNTKEGEVVYQVENYETAMKFKPLAESKKTIEVYVEPLKVAISGVNGKMVRYSLVNP